MPTRRNFFRAAAVLPPSWVAFQNLAQGAKADESYWRMVKRQFSLDEDIIYLNAANSCPASNPVMDRHLRFLRDFQGNPSFQNRLKYLTMQETFADASGRDAAGIRRRDRNHAQCERR
jgi:hypothetical protein